MLKGVAAALALLVGLGLLPPSTTAHAYHLQASNEVLNGPERVELNNWIAQSFLAPINFLVSRVQLYVADTGASDLLSVSIRGTSTFGFPDSDILSQGETDGPGPAGWLNINLSPYSPLNSSTTYWIVAH